VIVKPWLFCKKKYLWNSRSEKQKGYSRFFFLNIFFDFMKVKFKIHKNMFWKIYSENISEREIHKLFLKGVK